MSDQRRIMWNGAARALLLEEQLRAAATARCEALKCHDCDVGIVAGEFRRDRRP